MGSLYNIERVLSVATMLADPTYRNHIAPRMNQLVLVLLESTHTRLTKMGIEPDNEYVWKLPITRAELSKFTDSKKDFEFSCHLDNLVKQAPHVRSDANIDSADGSVVQARSSYVTSISKPAYLGNGTSHASGPSLFSHPGASYPQP